MARPSKNKTYSETYVFSLFKRCPWMYASAIATDLWGSPRYAYRIYAILRKHNIHISLIRRGEEDLP